MGAIPCGCNSTSTYEYINSKGIMNETESKLGTK